MRRKISAILVTVLIMLMVMPMGAFAAVPSVQEVETLIAQIGTVTRENRSAVENAVASDLSNGFVEGTNSKLKMVKRTMYGRCSRQLLEAKLMYRIAD